MSEPVLTDDDLRTMALITHMDYCEREDVFDRLKSVRDLYERVLELHRSGMVWFPPMKGEGNVNRTDER